MEHRRFQKTCFI